MTKYSKQPVENEYPSGRQRAAYGSLSGICGTILNLCLFCAKLTVGLLSASVSVLADAVNNLSDAGNSAVTFLGFKLANRPADREHPFGHGRYEYITGLGISAAILLMGLELVRSSVEKIFTPQSELKASPITFLILGASIAVKLFMFFFNRFLANKINSAALRASALDSASDCAATAMVIIGLAISSAIGVNIDGYLGLCVSAFIILTGISAFKAGLSPLLGKAPSPELVNEIRETVLSNDMIMGMHDLIVHDYGPGRCFISLHAEVPCTANIVTAHDAVDRTERQLAESFGCPVTIHMDPIATDDEYTNTLKIKIADSLCELCPEYSLHDFRVVHGGEQTKVVFDMLVPYSSGKTDGEIKVLAEQKIRELDASLTPRINVEKAMSE